MSARAAILFRPAQSPSRQETRSNGCGIPVIIAPPRALPVIPTGAGTPACMEWATSSRSNFNRPGIFPTTAALMAAAAA